MEDLYASINRVDTLKQRAGRCCCKYCGGPLSLKRLIFSDFTDARVEIYCEHCERIEYGVEPEIYKSARNFVDNLGFNYYTDMDQNAQTRRMNIAKVAEIMAWGYRNTGLLNDDGFTVPLSYKDTMMEQCLVITDDMLRAEGDDGDE